MRIQWLRVATLFGACTLSGTLNCGGQAGDAESSNTHSVAGTTAHSVGGTSASTSANVRGGSSMAGRATSTNTTSASGGWIGIVGGTYGNWGGQSTATGGVNSVAGGNFTTTTAHAGASSMGGRASAGGTSSSSTLAGTGGARANGGTTQASAGSSFGSTGGSNSSSSGGRNGNAGGTVTAAGSAGRATGGVTGTAGAGPQPGCAPVSIETIMNGSRCENRLDGFGASATEVVVWVEDSGATSGGYTVTLAGNQELSVGGHRYAFRISDSLFGGGAYSSGYVEIAVDGVSAQMRFDIAGCPLTSVSGGAVDGFVAQVKRNWVSHTPSQDIVQRRYNAIASTTSHGMKFVFSNPDAPVSCGMGLDLMGFTLGS